MSQWRLTFAAIAWLLAGTVYPLERAGGEPGEETCRCEQENPDAVLARVNGTPITLRQVDGRLGDQVERLRQMVEDARSRELDLQINSRLLEAEAKKRGISATELLEKEVTSQVAEPTESEARTYFEENRSRLEGDFSESKEEILAFLRNLREQERAAEFAERLREKAEVRALVEEVTSPRNESERGRVFARVQGDEITSADIEDSLQPLVTQVEEEIYARRKSALDVQINDLLLEQEARKRNLTAKALLEAEVAPRMAPITESTAEAFYRQNQDRIAADWDKEEDRLRLIQFLREREDHRATAAFAAELLESASVQIAFAAPTALPLSIAVRDQPMKGSSDAPVTIVEFIDYACPSCAGTQEILERLLGEFGGQVNLVARDFPRKRHAFAYQAALAAEAARGQGRYWEFIRILFQNQHDLGAARLKAFARELGLDGARFDEALETKQFADKVERDLQEGWRLGVRSTPTLFVNGRRVKDATYEGLRSAVESALRAKDETVEAEASRPIQ